MASYPTSVWDGTSDNRTAGQQKSPDWRDWNRMVAEVAAVQTEVDEVKAGSEEIGYINVDKDGYLMVGEFATGAATTVAAVFDTDRDVWSDGQLDILSVFAASDTDLTSAYSAKAGRFRHVIKTTAGTVAHETYGLVGQVVVRNTTLTHLHAGLMGTFEAHTEGVVLNSAYTIGHGGVIARVGGHAAITATTPLTGFLAFNNGAADLASGVLIAYGSAAASASYPWDALLGAAQCDVVLYVPTATDYESGVKAVAGTAPSGTVTHFIKVRVGASTYAYVPCYTADTVS